MEIIGVWLLFFAVFVDKGATCSVLSPICYKYSSQPGEDFICEWVDHSSSKNTTYELFMRNADRNCSLFDKQFSAGEKLSLYLPLEYLRISCLLDIWVQKQEGQMTCKSESITVVLNNLVKYNPPVVHKRIRKAEKVTLSWPTPNDNKGAIHEIRWKKINGSWKNDTFETYDSINKDTLETYTVQLEKDAAYQVQVRRKEKQSHLWSDWSQMYDIPTEMHPPHVQWKEETLYAGRRKIILYWDEPPREASLGGLEYKLTLTLPCQNKTETTNSTFFEIILTYSGAKVSCVASNKVGSVSSKQINIPPVKHFEYCPTDTLQESKPKKQYCLEWYELRDGETQQEKVNVRMLKFNTTKKDCPTDTLQESKYKKQYCLERYELRDGETQPEKVTMLKSNRLNKTKKDMNKLLNDGLEIKTFVRHYFFLHTGKNGHQATEIMCTFYSTEGKSAKSPKNLTVPDIKTNMPFTTFSSTDSGLLNRIILSVCGVLLLLSIVFSIVIRSLRSKLLPVIPSPVITTTAVPLDAQNMKTLTEEVHDVILVHQADQPKEKQNTFQQDCKNRVIHNEEVEMAQTLLTSLLIPNSYPNPNYKGQTITFSELLEIADKGEEETRELSTPLYKNGLFFDNRVSDSEETSVQL